MSPISPRGLPRDWDLAVAVAWLLLVGKTVSEIAVELAVDHTTIRSWMISDWWDEARDEARSQLPRYLESKALRALDLGLSDGDLPTARYIADRVIPELAPPASKVQVAADVPSWAEVVRLADAKKDGDA